MIGNDWDNILKDIYQLEYFNKIKDTVRYEYNHKVIFPPANKVFYALRLTSYKDTKVVILGHPARSQTLPRLDVRYDSYAHLARHAHHLRASAPPPHC